MREGECHTVGRWELSKVDGFRWGEEDSRHRGWAGDGIGRASPAGCAADNCGLHESGRDRASPARIAGHEVPPTSPVGLSKVERNRSAAFAAFVVGFLEVDGFVEGGARSWAC